KGTFKTAVNVGTAYNVTWKIVATYGEEGVQDATFYGCRNCDVTISIEYACPVIQSDKFYCSAPVQSTGSNETYQVLGQWQPFVTEMENATLDHYRNSLAFDVILERPTVMKLKVPRSL